jgi:hypothetical protein
MSSSNELISARRAAVQQSFDSAKAENHLRYLEGDVKATEEYIYPNQLIDATNIVNELLYKKNCRVVSIQKKTKVGADGLMIALALLTTTHDDNRFVVNPSAVRIITGMSNVSWEKDMKEKSPTCFREKIYHHGKLSRSDLIGIRNGLIIIDEIDTGDKEYQVLHSTLLEAGMLDVKHMEENNNRFIFISATMIKELHDLYRWGDLHELYKMTIPDSYISHTDFLELGIIQEFYPLDSEESSEKWVQEDILDYYGTQDLRVHIVRVTAKTVGFVQTACIRNGVTFKHHTSADRLSDEEIRELFKEPLTKHIVLGVKGFFRRANLIPNPWKLRIGAVHELYTRIVDYNVHIQGLPGRMTGYWRNIIEGGHKTGPIRTSIKAIREYENTYLDPLGRNSYHTSGFNKKNGKVTAEPTMLSPKNINNLVPVDLPIVHDDAVDINTYRIYHDEVVTSEVCKILDYYYGKTKDNADGFKETSLNTKKDIVSLRDAVRKVPTAYGTNNGVRTYRTYYPCYVDVTNRETLRFVVIIRPGTDPDKIAECDQKYPSLTL